MLKVTESPREVWRDVDLKERGSFKLQLRKPTWDQICEDSRRPEGYIAARLENCVIGWNGIEINGEGPDFSWDAFKLLCEKVPLVFHLACGLVSDLYYSLGEEQEKNSGEASSGS